MVMLLEPHEHGEDKVFWGSWARKLLMDRLRSRRNLARAVKTMEKARSGRLEAVERAIEEFEPGEGVEAEKLRKL